jgi:hypothetical protein
LVEGTKAYRSWHLVVLACEESEQAAAREAAEAFELRPARIAATTTPRETGHRSNTRWNDTLVIRQNAAQASLALTMEGSSVRYFGAIGCALLSQRHKTLRNLQPGQELA